MSHSNEIVLIDSSSDEDEAQQNAKRFKPDPEIASHSNGGPTNGTFSIAPFQEVSSSSGDEEAEENEDTYGNDIRHLVILLDSDTPGASQQDEEQVDDDDGDDSEGLTRPSNRAPPISETSQQQEPIYVSSGDDDEDDEDSSSSDDLEPNFDFEDVPPDLIAETRKYLKAHGNIQFLEKYLPTAASVEHIVKLILQLGFVPKNLPRPHSSNIMEYIKILNHAMMKVKSIRNRREDVRTLEDALQLIENSSKILVITGAGISTSLGIPDFRSSKGFYSMVQHLGLSDPQEVFDLELFHIDPSLFYSIAHMILPPEKMFSPMHSFIKVLETQGKLLRNYTQNIDNLESYAGIRKSKLVQCHGSFATASCVTCGFKINGEDIFEKIRAKEIPLCLLCTKRKNDILKKDDDYYFAESYGVFKPDITFFGEALPSNFHDHIREDILECDLLICAGTSLKVAPVSDIVDKVPEKVPQILINRDPIGHCCFDVSLLGYCDEVVSYIANKLGDEWSLPHKDYDAIRGENGENLEVELIDAALREYHIFDKTKVEEEEVVEIEVLEMSDEQDGEGVEVVPQEEDAQETDTSNTPQARGEITIENTPLADDNIPPTGLKENTPIL
ncbi:NAD-dependent protein deacetylase HST1 [Candida viswanathii]|uniref:NAD-dependent protein deacetylase HST1 n=1 Tax=Candida viswanathii TaxID=5486 RepID=A0A367YCR1_9ASCO|nr:NAD-dependent protein deacetylase HST1 [Candida viswanathii]